MPTRVLPSNFVGTNLRPQQFLDDGFSMKSSGMITKTGTGSQNSTTITLNNVSGLSNNMFVTGVNIPALNSSGEPTVIKSINQSNSTITLNSNLRLSINNLNVYFHSSQTSIEYILHIAAASGIESLRSSIASWQYREPSAPINGVHNYRWTDGSGEDKYNLDEYILMVSQLGINLMPRLGGIPNWARDFDYLVETNGNPFVFQNPEVNGQKVQGVRVTATGTAGSKKVTVTNMDRAFLIVPGMTIGNITNPTLVSEKLAYGNTNANFIAVYGSVSDLTVNQYIEGPKIPSMTRIKSITTGNPNLIYLKTVTGSDAYLTGGYLYRQKIKFYTSNSFPTAYDQDSKQDAGFVAGTRITKVTKNSNNYVFDIDKPLLANLSGTFNMTAGISNYQTNNGNKSIKNSKENNQAFKFDSYKDLVVFLINLRRRGGHLPRNKYDHFQFLNALLTRYGTNGTIWNDSTVQSLSATTSGTSNPNSTAFSQTISLSAVPAKTVVGMTVSDSSTTNENNKYIPFDTKIIAINGNSIIVDKALLKSIPTGITIKFNFPKITNWQIWNEVTNPAYGTNNWGGGFYYQINNGAIKKIEDKYLTRGANWPLHPSSINGPHGEKISLIDKNYGIIPSFTEFLGEIKKEIHTTDPYAKIVTGAIAANLISTVKQMLATKVGNIDGKYSFDKLGVNIYPSLETNGPAQLVTWPIGKSSSDPNSIAYVFKNNLKGYGTPTPNFPSFPNLIVSEFGWSTDQVGLGSKHSTTENGLANRIDKLFAWSASSTSLDVRKLVKNNFYWNIESIMYFPWTSNETGYATAAKTKDKTVFAGFILDNSRGIYKYKNPAIKTGSIQGTKNTGIITFSANIPSQWAVGDTIRKKDRAKDPEKPKPLLSSFQDNSKILSINSGTKTITIDKNIIDENLNTTFSEGSTVNAAGERYLYVSTKIEPITRGTVPNVTVRISRTNNPSFDTAAEKFQTKVLDLQGR